MNENKRQYLKGKFNIALRAMLNVWNDLLFWNDLK